MWYNIILRSIEYKVWVFLHILWSLAFYKRGLNYSFWENYLNWIIIFKTMQNSMSDRRFLMPHQIWAKEFLKFLHHIWMLCPRFSEALKRFSKLCCKSILGHSESFRYTKIWVKKGRVPILRNFSAIFWFRNFFLVFDISRGEKNHFFQNVPS